MLPAGADAEGVGMLTEELEVARGMGEDDKTRRQLASNGWMREGERAYQLFPRDHCHCSWSPARFAELAMQSLERGYAPAVGVIVGDFNWWPPRRGRRESVSAVAFAGGAHDDFDVVYVVEPDADSDADS